MREWWEKYISININNPNEVSHHFVGKSCCQHANMMLRIIVKAVPGGTPRECQNACKTK